jgi:hypothetical protein
MISEIHEVPWESFFFKSYLFHSFKNKLSGFTFERVGRKHYVQGNVLKKISDANNTSLIDVQQSLNKGSLVVRKCDLRHFLTNLALDLTTIQRKQLKNFGRLSKLCLCSYTPLDLRGIVYATCI